MEPLLCNDREVSKYLSKNVSAATDTHATIDVKLETVFSTRAVPRSYNADNSDNLVSSIREVVKQKKTAGRELEGIRHSDGT